MGRSTSVQISDRASHTMARLSLFLLACLVVIAVTHATQENESNDLTETNFDALERVARDAEPGKRKGRRAKKLRKKKKAMKKRKQRKAKKAKKGKKGKKAKKNMKKVKGAKRSGTCRQTDAACITNICDAWKLRNGKVRNYIRQTKRMVNHAAISKKKLEKKGEFKDHAAILTNVLGGNASAPACAKSDGTDGNDAGDAATSLGKCEKDVEAACPEITPNSNHTGAGGCNATIYAFKEKVEGCGNGDTADSCACYAAAMTMKDAVTACATEATTLMQDVKAKKDVCKTSFAGCKKLQDKAVGFSATCHKGGKHGKKTTAGSMGTTKGMRRNRILRQLMAQNLKRQAKLNQA